MIKYAPIILTLLFTTHLQAKLIIDKDGVDEKEYIYDMNKCEELANQTKKDNGSRGAVGGAIKGAAIGSAGKAIAGGSGSDGAKKGAAVGLATGVVGGSRDRRKNQQNYEQEKETVLRNCMSNRGYAVLN
ncbi:glycine zipper family protein [Vibrio sp. L5-1]|uniref:RNA polymerase subunit sigma n=1 Tax=Vibrio splendidus TaxID=29497 RepID=A0A837NZQ1_VIBSP|nr:MULTISPECIES: glycine zipper family protein [Vibrio]KPL95732.1 RNA polymerase subunit sigma [Vibrio splendidus]MCF7493697.1 glycine zipper family protein [Vibrio sp. L5-1]